MGIGMAIAGLLVCATLCAVIIFGVNVLYTNFGLRVLGATLGSMIFSIVIIFFVIALFVTSHMYYNE